jgi:hypothetical protein
MTIPRWVIPWLSIRESATGDRRSLDVGSLVDSHDNCDSGSEVGQSTGNSQDGIPVAEAVEG